MADHFDRYRTLLAQQGLRVTPQRIVILQAIDEGKNHLTADAITSRIREQFPAISPATVYRALDQFCKAGIISESRLIERQTVYELMGEHPHNHLVCEVCGHSTEIGNTELQLLFATLNERYRFVARPQHIVISGLCAQCAQRLDA